jgi:putative ABC transport system substrate-binding protein
VEDGVRGVPAVVCAEALEVVADPAISANDDVRQQIIRWASARRLPLASPGPRVAPGGGLVSLSTDLQAPARRAALYVHRILGGARPADLPVERPTIYRLSVNQTTAVALGLTIPQSVRLRADEVIE